MHVPTWVTNSGLVILIFGVGSYVARLEVGLRDINEDIRNLETKVVKVETAISIHHGVDWSVKVEEKTLKRVDEIEKTIGGLSRQFGERVGKLGKDFSDTVDDLSDLGDRFRAVHEWTKQGDAIIQESRLEQFRALAVYSDRAVSDRNRIFINKQHDKAFNFEKGDEVILANPLPPGRQVEAVVEGFIDDPNNSNVLVQLNVKLLQNLDLDTKLGRYELFVQGKREYLRWKSLDELLEQVKKSRNAG